MLSQDTGYRRDYTRSPYAGYAQSPQIMFEVTATDGRFHAKEWVIGVEINGVFKAYPFSRLPTGQHVLVDQVGGQTIQLVFDTINRSGRIYVKDKLIPSTMSYWFAWYAFHPDTLVYQAENVNKIYLNETQSITFDPNKNILLDKGTASPEHPNGMIFELIGETENVLLGQYCQLMRRRKNERNRYMSRDPRGSNGFEVLWYYLQS